MIKSYSRVALAVFVSGFLLFSTAAAQSTKQTIKQTINVKVVREGVGFDGITVGRSTEADVIKKFGKNFRRKAHKKYSYQMIYPNGVSFYFCQQDKTKRIFDIELRAPFAAKTARGIAIGKSTLEDIYKIYGKKPLRADGSLDLQYRGVSFFYKKSRGKNVVTVIDIVESKGIRQCEESSPKTKNK